MRRFFKFKDYLFHQPEHRYANRLASSAVSPGAVK